MKAHLKRAPSLRGTALVRLSSLKVQAKIWPTLFNKTKLAAVLDKVINNRLYVRLINLIYVLIIYFQIEISSDNWFDNVIKIYQLNNEINQSFQHISQETSHSS